MPIKRHLANVTRSAPQRRLAAAYCLCTGLPLFLAGAAIAVLAGQAGGLPLAAIGLAITYLACRLLFDPIPSR